MTTPRHTKDPLVPLRLVLASRSPRRRDLLNRAGFDHTAVTPSVDDSNLDRPAGLSPQHWVAALAYFKAAAVADGLPHDIPRAGALVLGADTVCVLDDVQILGQPKDAQHARSMIQQMAGRTHAVLTGVALIGPAAESRLVFTQSAVVRVGHIGAQQIDDYVRTKMWQGKAGAYNLIERIEAGWPIECTGDPTTVMGLPMDALSPILSPALGLPSPTSKEVSR